MIIAVTQRGEPNESCRRNYDVKKRVSRNRVTVLRKLSRVGLRLLPSRNGQHRKDKDRMIERHADIYKVSVLFMILSYEDEE